MKHADTAKKAEMETQAARFKDALRAVNMTQVDFADFTGWTPETVNRWSSARHPIQRAAFVLLDLLKTVRDLQADQQQRAGVATDDEGINPAALLVALRRLQADPRYAAEVDAIVPHRRNSDIDDYYDARDRQDLENLDAPTPVKIDPDSEAQMRRKQRLDARNARIKKRAERIVTRNANKPET